MLRQGDIFDYKDIWKRSQKRGDSMLPLTPSKGSDMSLVSTGIYASSMSSHSGGSDTDEPLAASSGIDAASHTDSSLGSEILEILPSSTDCPRRDLLKSHPQPNDPPLALLPVEKGIVGTLPRTATLEREAFELPTMELKMETNKEVDTDHR